MGVTETSREEGAEVETQIETERRRKKKNLRKTQRRKRRGIEMTLLEVIPRSRSEEVTRLTNTGRRNPMELRMKESLYLTERGTREDNLFCEFSCNSNHGCVYTF